MHQTMASPIPTRPPFDPAYKLARGQPGSPADLPITEMRKALDATTADDILASHPNMRHTEHTAPGILEFSNAPVVFSLFEPKNSTSRSRGLIIHAHGGGQVMGNRFTGVQGCWAGQGDMDDVVVATIEYRLAPEHRAPAAAYDCYAAIVHLSEHARTFGIDPARIVIMGVSGGAAPLAAACLLARRTKRPKPGICGAVLSFPMIDDREHYTSWKQFETGTLWSGRYNRQAWEQVLGPGDREAVTELQVPARAESLAGLPDMLVEVGECEVFRDSATAFAKRVLADGGSCELHVWPGMYHAGAGLEADVAVSQVARGVQRSFIRRKLGLVENVSEAVKAQHAVL